VHAPGRRPRPAACTRCRRPRRVPQTAAASYLQTQTNDASLSLSLSFHMMLSKPINICQDRLGTSRRERSRNEKKTAHHRVRVHHVAPRAAAASPPAPRCAAAPPSRATSPPPRPRPSRQSRSPRLQKHLLLIPGTFPSVCPEPVLVNDRLLSTKDVCCRTVLEQQLHQRQHVRLLRYVERRVRLLVARVNVRAELSAQARQGKARQGKARQDKMRQSDRRTVR
jgi:hypothetical protein